MTAPLEQLQQRIVSHRLDLMICCQLVDHSWWQHAHTAWMLTLPGPALSLLLLLGCLVNFIYHHHHHICIVLCQTCINCAAFQLLLLWIHPGFHHLPAGNP